MSCRPNYAFEPSVTPDQAAPRARRKYAPAARDLTPRAAAQRGRYAPRHARGYCLALASILLGTLAHGSDEAVDSAPKCEGVRTVEMLDLFDTYKGSKCYVPMVSADLQLQVLIGTDGKAKRVGVESVETNPPEAKECVISVSAAVIFHGRFSRPPTECRKPLKLTFRQHEGA